MKKYLLAAAVVCGLLAPLATTTDAFADVYVNGYYRQNGTYVQPHYRSNPDGNPYNNYSNWK